MKIIRDAASAIQRRLFSPGHFIDYLLLAILAALPMLLARAIGINYSQTRMFASSKATCAGYWERGNWISLIVLLPAALWTARIIADLLFCQSARFKKYKRIPDLVPGESEASTGELHDAFADGRNLLAAVLIAFLVQLIDMWATLVPYARSLHKTSPVSVAPYRWDWALWFVSNPNDRALYWKDMGLVVVAYASQFGMALIAISLIILLLRHNHFYLRSIYLRSRATKFPRRPMVPLDFGAADLHFGLQPLFVVFNVQLLMLAAAGAYTLVSRASNSDTTAMSTCLVKLTSGEFKFSEFWGAVFGNLGLLFPTIGQRVFPMVFLVMFVIVLLPAFVKLLPVPEVLSEDRIDARHYLLEFLLPDAEMATRTHDLENKEDVDDAASKFSQQSFWPVSQTSAEFFSVSAFFVFFLILAPVFRWPPSVGHILFYAALLVMSFLCSAALFSVFRYTLRVIDPRLVGKEGKEK